MKLSIIIIIHIPIIVDKTIDILVKFGIKMLMVRFFFVVIIVIKTTKISCYRNVTETDDSCIIQEVNLNISHNIIIYDGQLLNKSCRIFNFAAENINLQGIKSYAFSNVDIMRISICQNNLLILKSFTFINSVIIEIRLSDNKIFVIEKNAFKNVSSLHFLDLSLNNIYEINDKSFVNTHLLSLNMSFNNLRMIRKHYFKLFNKDCALDVFNNDIEALEDDAFEFIANANGTIIEIELGSNKIEKINETLFRNVTIHERMGLSYNPIKEIPQSIYEMKFEVLECLKCAYLDIDNVRMIKYWSKRNGYIFFYSNSPKNNGLNVFIASLIINILFINY